MVLIEEIVDGNVSERTCENSEQPERAAETSSGNVAKQTASSPQGVEEAEAQKQKGNEAYKNGDYLLAIDYYSQCLELVPESTAQRSVYHANRAAAHLGLEQYKEAVQDCSAALEIDEKYIKALMRRSSAHEGLDDLEHALEDAKKVLELDGSNVVAKATVKRLEPAVLKRREELKDEMLGKLKEMGNAVLGKFGMSLDNFKATKDPESGSYSINFQN